jgi:hypothetical protein
MYREAALRDEGVKRNPRRLTARRRKTAEEGTRSQ